MPDNLGTMLILLGVMVLLFLLVLPRLMKRTATPLLRPGAFDEPPPGPRVELEQLLAEIQDISRQQIAKLDTKIRVLNQLLLECDQKKKEIEELLRRSGGPAPPAAAPSRPPNPLHSQVYSLQDTGKDLGEICSATGLEKGEVELILGLRKMPPAGS